MDGLSDTSCSLTPSELQQWWEGELAAIERDYERLSDALAFGCRWEDGELWGEFVRKLPTIHLTVESVPESEPVAEYRLAPCCISSSLEDLTHLSRIDRKANEDGLLDRFWVGPKRCPARDAGYTWKQIDDVSKLLEPLSWFRWVNWLCEHTTPAETRDGKAYWMFDDVLESADRLARTVAEHRKDIATQRFAASLKLAEELQQDQDKIDATGGVSLAPVMEEKAEVASVTAEDAGVVIESNQLADPLLELTPEAIRNLLSRFIKEQRLMGQQKQFIELMIKDHLCECDTKTLVDKIDTAQETEEGLWSNLSRPLNRKFDQFESGRYAIERFDHVARIVLSSQRAATFRGKKSPATV